MSSLVAQCGLPNPRLFLPLLLALALLPGAVPLGVCAAQDELATPEQPAEYMIYQYPSIALVVRVDVPETEFGVRVLGPENAMVRSSGVPGRRIGPVFTYIDAADLPRQLMIEVTPGHTIPRAAIGLEVLQFAAGDRNVAVLRRAYQLFSLGTETALSDDTTSWAMKTYSLRNAANLFDQLGMEEMRLWSEYFAAHQVLHQLEDRLMAMELAQEIQRAAARAGFEEVDLAARVLEGDALLQRMTGTAAAASGIDYPRLHELLQGVAALAGQLGFAAEAGRAYFKDGLVFDHRGESPQALEQYERALEAIAQTADPELLNEVRATAAAAYEALGRTSGALAMLDQIEGELTAGPRDDAALELADSLLEKGRLLNAAYLYRDAASELARALELQQANVANRSWGPTGLELAWAQYSLGRADEAIAMIQEALPRTPPEGNAELLARAYGSLAKLHRARGRFDQAAQARETQGKLVGEGEGRAELLFETAMDAWQRYGPASREAHEMLRWSQKAAAGEGDRLTEARSALQLCVLEAERGGELACSEDAMRAPQEVLRNSGVPRLAAEAGLARSRILRRTGRTAEARGEFENLLGELQWYRRMLPGVLGAWYPENRDSLARESFALALAGAGPARDSASIGVGDSAGGRFLLTLERLRMVEAADNPAATLLDPQADEALRGLLARCQAARGEEARDLAAEVNRQIETARQSCPQCGFGDMDSLSAGDLQALLQGLDRSEGVLAYFLDGGEARVAIAGRDGVRTANLAQPERIQSLLARVRESLSGPASAAVLADLEALGKLLLQPLGRDLPPRIYLLSAGLLRGVPFDALRLDGRYLAEQHLVVNLASLRALERRQPRVGDGYRERVFVAGNPQNQLDPFRFEISRSPEIGAVTDRFVGPGLHVVQGVALRKDEFADDRFMRAALVHLAIPGVIDLASPERSRLLLAAATAGATGSGLVTNPDDYLSPTDVTAFELGADLLLLTATGVGGSSESPFDGRVPLVSDFLDAGAAAVVFSLWPVGEVAATEFARELYGRLESDPDIGRAFMAARNALMTAGEAPEPAAWAGFQLFIR